MSFARRLVRALPLLLLSPFLALLAGTALLAADLAWFIFGRRRLPAARQPRAASASVVIPNWNGRDLLEKYLPSVVTAMADHPANEIIVVDNASQDGSAEFVSRMFPGVKLVRLSRNLGFGGGSNAGFAAARNDIVVLLNNDMRVEPDFLAPLLAGFRDEAVFAVSCQIFLSDPAKRREETGLTEGRWKEGGLRVSHRADPRVRDLFPCFYGGGGSCAFDRHKFLELGGFDELLAPFYLEDTDLGYLAWKRGWKVLYQPRSIVWHEHRGTIGKRFREDQIQAVLKKNHLLFAWKNMHSWGRLAEHLFFAWTGALVSAFFGDAPGRANPAAWWRAACQLRQAVRSRRQARSLAVLSDAEAFARPRAGYFHDRFGEPESEDRHLRVLFVSPYPICPPVHGGGVFMYQTLRRLVEICEVHLIVVLDEPGQRDAHEELRRICASVEFVDRVPIRTSTPGSLVPHAVKEFSSDALEWLIGRQIYEQRIDVLQLEYTPLGQYAGGYRRIVSAIFEHDIYFQSVARGLKFGRRLERLKARYEYLRALRFELRMLRRCDLIEVCTPRNRDYLASFLPRLAGRIRSGLRAGIDTAAYRFEPRGRDPGTILFVGSDRHEPNRISLRWFAREVLPLIVARHPGARLLVVGSDPPAQHPVPELASAVHWLGLVDDVREPLSRCAVFVCPILSGSGVRVKLLEAFAVGIPAVSTRIGAEGLAERDGEFCFLADSPEEFAARVVEVLRDPQGASGMAQRARAEVATRWDIARATEELAKAYGETLRRKPGAAELLDAVTVSRGSS